MARSNFSYTLDIQMETGSCKWVWPLEQRSNWINIGKQWTGFHGITWALWNHQREIEHRSQVLKDTIYNHYTCHGYQCMPRDLPSAMDKESLHCWVNMKTFQLGVGREEFVKWFPLCGTIKLSWLESYPYVLNFLRSWLNLCIRCPCWTESKTY